MGREINVVGAVIVSDGRVLCAQRGPGGSLAGMWEFPGGKIEENEAPAEALVREIREELHCDVTLDDQITTTSCEYDFGIINLTTFYCRLSSGVPQITEHEQFVWAAPGDLDRFDWAPADIPTVEIIRRGLA
ncbi:MAG: (deoxy)nucleoside triphosphate pyrophosphohydrolase [Solirubrobacterales bacterium]